MMADSESSVRLPEKFKFRSRGFAFFKFVFLHETDLLGRHMVLEWAEETERDLEVSRKKAARGVGLMVEKRYACKKTKVGFS